MISFVAADTLSLSLEAVIYRYAVGKMIVCRADSWLSCNRPQYTWKYCISNYVTLYIISRVCSNDNALLMACLCTIPKHSWKVHPRLCLYCSHPMLGWDHAPSFPIVLTIGLLKRTNISLQSFTTCMRSKGDSAGPTDHHYHGDSEPTANLVRLVKGR